MSNTASILRKASIFIVIASLSIFSSCATKRKKTETSKFGKFYHNLTSEYNGYFNANELYNDNLEKLRQANVDNYSKILEIDDFVSVDDPKMVNGDMDKAVEKVTKVAAIHEKGDWVDDCYVLMAKAQYLKQDYETTLETLEFFEEEFNPSNPFGKNFQKKKLSSKEKAKLKAAEREDAKKAKEQERKAAEKAREEVKKEKEEDRKAISKQREEEKKAREKAAKDRKKSSGKRTPKPKETAKTTSDSTLVANQNPNLVKKETVPSKEIAPLETEKDKAKEKKKPVKKDETAYNEGLVWLAKTYIKTEQYSNAEFLLQRIDDTEGIQDEVKELLYAAQAEAMIKQKRYADALPYLDKAIENAPSRDLKGRYAFIAGQLLQLNKNYANSVSYFQKSKKYSKSFKMKFMSELAVSKNSIFSGNKTEEQVAAELQKMLKEEKYVDFRDQIYFSMAEIELKSGKNDLALEYFKNSAQVNKNDQSLKAETYLHIAELDFEKENYVEAKMYYDSTYFTLSKTDDRYLNVKNLASNLSSIAANIQKIEKFDTLLAMANLPKEELNKIALQRLEDEKKNGKAASTVDPAMQSKVLNGSRAVSNNSTFFAYNLASLETGKIDFRKTWGNRKLEDDWRTKRESEIINDLASNTKPDDTEIVYDLSEDEFKRLMSEVPFSPIQKDKYNQEVKKAMFELGKQYRDNLQNYAKSIVTLEELNRRFPDHGDMAEALYYLSLDYIDVGNPSKAKECQNKIVQDYPSTKFAKIINDPAFGEALIAEKNRLEKYYDQTYDLFKKSQYEKVRSRIDNATETFGKENKLIAKFALLNAMCLGSTDGKEAYIKGLQEVIARYPKTPEETKAKEIMRFLGGDKTAFENIGIEEVDDIFQMEDDKRHYVAVILFDDSDSVLQSSKIAVSEYNKEFHSLEYLQLGESGISQTEKTQEILIRSFDNKDKAMAYYNEVMKDKEKFIPSSISGYFLCAITQANHRKMIAARSHKQYQVFFENHYLNPDNK